MQIISNVLVLGLNGGFICFITSMSSNSFVSIIIILKYFLNTQANSNF